MSRRDCTICGGRGFEVPSDPYLSSLGVHSSCEGCTGSGPYVWDTGQIVWSASARAYVRVVRVTEDLRVVVLHAGLEHYADPEDLAHWGDG